MLKRLKDISKNISRFKKEEIEDDNFLIENVNEDELLKGVPRYPPFKTGLPVVDPKLIIATQKDIIEDISSLLGFNDEQLELYLHPLIRKYAEFVHLIPASQSHHHKGAGGLLRHGLEVGKFAILFSEDMIMSTEGSLQQRNNAQIKWRFAAFICGLLHDIGKPLTDLTVNTRDGNYAWVTLGGESLYEWCTRLGVDNYYIHYHHNRHAKHQGVTSVLMAKMLTDNIQRFLTEDGNQSIFVAISNAINGTSAMDRLSNIMIKADRASVKKDLREQSQVEADVNFGVPVVRFVFDAMRSLVNQGKWKLNDPNSGVFNTDIGFFVDFETRMGDVNKEIKELGFEGVPSKSDEVLRIFIEQGYAIPYMVDGQAWNQWEIQLYINQEGGGMKIPMVTRRLVCLSDPGQVFTNPPSHTIKAEAIKYIRNENGTSEPVVVISSEILERNDETVVDELEIREKKLKEKLIKESGKKVIVQNNRDDFSEYSSELEEVYEPNESDWIEQFQHVQEGIDIERTQLETPDMENKPVRKEVKTALATFSELTKAGLKTDPSRKAPVDEVENNSESEIELTQNDSFPSVLPQESTPFIESVDDVSDSIMSGEESKQNKDDTSKDYDGTNNLLINQEQKEKFLKMPSQPVEKVVKRKKATVKSKNKLTNFQLNKLSIFDVLDQFYLGASDYLNPAIKFAEIEGHEFGLNEVLTVEGTQVIIMMKKLSEFANFLKVERKFLVGNLRNSGAVKNNPNGFGFIEKYGEIEGFVLVDELSLKIISHLTDLGMEKQLNLSHADIQEIEKGTATLVEINKENPLAATPSRKTMHQIENEKMISRTHPSIKSIVDLIIRQVVSGRGKYVDGLLSENGDSSIRYLPFKVMDLISEDFVHYGYTRRQIQSELTDPGKGCIKKDDFIVFYLDEIEKHFGYYRAGNAPIPEGATLVNGQK